MVNREACFGGRRIRLRASYLWLKTRKRSSIVMKSTTCAVICSTALTLASALGQQPTAPAPPPAPPPPALAPVAPPAPVPAQPSFSSQLNQIIEKANASPAPEPEPSLPRFNLDFPGGTPAQLVAAIEKAMGGPPLNAIVPEDLAATRLPAVKMNNVDVAQLFSAMIQASRKSELLQTGGAGYGGGYGSYQIHQGSCGFKTEGKPRIDSIWYFFAEKPVIPPTAQPPKVCRFYSLAAYLDRGIKVDDIMTAIETGWKMMGNPSPTTFKFHQDTKLLIAVGEPSMLETIDAVLKALDSPKAEPPKPGVYGVAPHPPGAPSAKPPEKPQGDK